MKKSKRVKTLVFTDFKRWMHERILVITSSQKHISNINNNNNNSLLFVCCVNSCNANYRHSTMYI
jgi:hypothetical protein